MTGKEISRPKMLPEGVRGQFWAHVTHNWFSEAIWLTVSPIPTHALCLSPTKFSSAKSEKEVMPKILVADQCNYRNW